MVSAAQARQARTSISVSLGYASRRSSIAAPSASLRRTVSTGMRVSRITGLPNITDGLISMRSIMKTLDAIVAGTLRYPMRLAGILVLTGGDAAMHFIVRFEP